MIIRTSMNNSAPKGSEPHWNHLLGELLAEGSTLSAETEQLLLDVLEFEGRLQLNEDGEMPHSMSPENMLKSLAVQFLGHASGPKHRSAMEKLFEKSDASLRCIIRAVIEKHGNDPAR